MRRPGIRGNVLCAMALMGAIASCAGPGGGVAPGALAVTAPAVTPRSTSTPRLLPSATIQPIPSPSPTPYLCPQRVLVISMDGVRPDALSAEATPHVWALAMQGAYTWTAQTEFPSYTLPAHASMLTGYEIKQHGVYWNDYIPSWGMVKTFTLFSIAHDAGLWTGMLVGKMKLAHIAVEGSLDEFLYADAGDAQMRDLALGRIEAGFDVLFVHFRSPDKAGHRGGWMSEGYLEAVRNVDGYIGEIVQVLTASATSRNALVIVTADHGGHGKGHGSDLPEDMTIPWMTWGPGVCGGCEISAPVRIEDTTATALWALGLPLPLDISGRVVEEAFQAHIAEACVRLASELLQ
jgi:arylsulfatase A-like enzyme